MSRINIGGQAVMEGVMMRNNDRYAVAVRKPDKQIEVKTNRCTGTSDRPAVCNLPIVRGVFSDPDPSWNQAVRMRTERWRKRL